MIESLKYNTKALILLLIGVLIVVFGFVYLATNQSKSSFGLFGRAQQKSATLMIRPSLQNPSEILLTLDPHGEQVRFVRIEADFDRPSTSISSVKNTSPFKQGGVSPDMILLSSKKAMQATGSLAFVLGARPEDAVQSDPILSIATITIESKGGSKKLSKSQEVGKVFTINAGKSQIVTDNGRTMDIEVVYTTNEPTGSSTTGRRK